MTAADAEARVLACLESSGHPYTRLPCDPEHADTASFCTHYGVPPEQSANTILVATRKKPKSYCACVVAASTRLDVNRCVRALMGGAKVSFASAEETLAVTGMLLGGVTPFALPADLPIFVDEGLMEQSQIVLGGGSRSAKIRISPGVFQALPGATIIAGLALPRGG